MNRAIRISTALVVIALGGIAAVISYRHAYAVATAHGEAGATGRLVPLTVDGLVFVASMVMLDSARRRVRAPALARLALALGIGATVAVNVLHGIAHGVIGALVSAWPAVTLVVVVELLMGMIRQGREDGDALDAPPVAGAAEAESWHGPVGMEVGETVPAVESPVATGDEVLATVATGDREHGPGVTESVTETAGGDPALAPVVATAREQFEGTLATGALPSVRALRRELRIGHPRAVRVRAALAVEVAE